MKTDTPKFNYTMPVQGTIGHVKCINVAKLYEPAEIRFVGYGNRDITKGPTGQPHKDLNDAVRDVNNWHEGKPVEYPKQAEMEPGYTDRLVGANGTARLAPMVAAGVKASKRVGDVFNMGEAATFVIGPNNTWPQAWEAMLAGHRVRRPEWWHRYSWLFENNSRDILLVEGGTLAEWRASGRYDVVTPHMLLATDWIVLPKTDYIPPTT
jgi:hypothetical protein